MGNHPIFAAALFISLALWCFAAEQPAKSKPFVQAPDTVAPEARKWLTSLSDPATTPILPGPDDAAGWKRAWQAAETASEPRVKATLDRYQPSVTKRNIGGVPVLDVKPKDWKHNGAVLIHLHGGQY